MKSALLLFLLLAGQAARQPATMRDALAVAGNTDVRLYPDYLLNTKLDDEVRKGRYFHVGYHINPSAEGLFILSSDGKILTELQGWELTTLADGSIVYHNNEVHFAPTHSMSISIFTPATGKDRQIYPQKPYQPPRREFINRVANAYKERGEDWFRNHNHHMNPELFDSVLMGRVMVDLPSKSISFAVRFGDPDNAQDPIPFTQRVLVRCAPIDDIERLQCRERAE